MNNNWRGVRAKVKGRSIIIDSDKYNNDEIYSKSIDESLKTLINNKTAGIQHSAEK